MAERILAMDGSKLAGNRLKSVLTAAKASGALRVGCACIFLFSFSAVELRAQPDAPDPCAGFPRPPVAKSQSVFVASGSPTKTITLSASGQEPLAYHAGTFEEQSGGGPNVTETLSGPKLSIHAPAGSFGIYTFTFSVTDQANRPSSKDGTVYITVLPDAELQNPPAGPAPAPAADSLEAATKNALAAEWGNPSETQYVLNALQLLTSSANVDRLDCKVLQDLKGINPYNPRLKNPCIGARTGKPTEESRQGLYVAALGNPDDSGQPTLQGLPDFVDLLAKANNLGLKAPGDENTLFACTKNLIDKIFQDPNLIRTPFPEPTDRAGLMPPNIAGPVALEIVDSSFKANNLDVALYELLDSFTQSNSGPTGTCADMGACAAAMEDLRAAFDMDSKNLANQVSVKIGAQKQP